MTNLIGHHDPCIHYPIGKERELYVGLFIDILATPSRDGLRALRNSAVIRNNVESVHLLVSALLLYCRCKAEMVHREVRTPLEFNMTPLRLLFNSIRPLTLSVFGGLI
jgi:hypothetical protein